MRGQSRRAESGAESDLLAAGTLKAKVLLLLKAQPLSKAELVERLGLSAVTGQLNRQVRELVIDDLIAATIADKPNSRLQRYTLTKACAKALNKRS